MAKNNEKHTVTFQDHELVVNGTVLRERKEVATFLFEGEANPYRTTLTHTRSIEDNQYQVFEVMEGQEVTEHIVTTTLKDGEVEAFHQEWKEKWNPAVNEDSVAKAQELSEKESSEMESVPKNLVALNKGGKGGESDPPEKKGPETSGEELSNLLHLQNKKRKDAVENVFIEKDYHSGGKYIRELNPKTGKTVSFYYENSTGNVFYTRYEPKPQIKFYHNKKTGKKYTINMETGEKKTEYITPEGWRPSEEDEELDPEMAKMEKEVDSLIEGVSKKK